MADEEGEEDCWTALSVTRRCLNLRSVCWGEEGGGGGRREGEGDRCKVKRTMSTVPTSKRSSPLFFFLSTMAVTCLFRSTFSR